MEYEFVVLSHRFAESRGKFQTINGKFFSLDEEDSSVDIMFTISATGSYQEIIGFGGAFTDAAVINILSLSEGAQENLLESYFSTHGSEYSLGRVPIAGCDFSTHVYSYDDFPGDFELAKFSLTVEDLEMKIPVIKRASAMAEEPLKIYGSVWYSLPLSV